MKSKLYTLVLLVVMIGCASTRNKVLDEKISKESAISSRADLQAEAKSSVDNDVNLSAEQKEKLTKLRVSISSQLDKINKESLELRSVLMKDVLSSKYNRKEVSMIKNRMRKLEDRRLSTIFDGADKANVILGRQADQNLHVMREFLGRYEGHE